MHALKSQTGQQKRSNANYKDFLSFNTTLQKKGVILFPFYLHSLFFFLSRIYYISRCNDSKHFQY
jgi:hypothetical protein